MTTVNASSSTEALDFTLFSNQVEFAARDPDGGNSPTGYSWLTTGGDDVAVLGSGIDFNGNPPAFGLVDVVEIDLSNTGPAVPADVRMTNITPQNGGGNQGSAQLALLTSGAQAFFTELFSHGDIITAGNSGDTIKAGGGSDLIDLRGGNDTALGDDGNDIILGGTGNDSIEGNEGNDDLSGEANNDTLDGGAGNDTLFGGSGNDTMRGGQGSDTYFVSDGFDVVDEGNGSGVDLVNATVSYSLLGQVFGDVENVTLIGGGDLNATGNGLANRLTGNSGRNLLDGGQGDDRMVGRGGDDRYTVDSAGDIVDESLQGLGNDEVGSSISIDLSGPNVRGSVENARLLGNANINAHGNALDNQLIGNNGVNVITGAAGNDKLTGFGGNDFFVFASALNATTNVDTIEDFNVPQDTMRLENLFFTGLANGTLAAGAFHIGSAAADASDRVIYDDDTGAMFFDQDGTGAAAAVRFATLDAGLAMTNADIFVI